MAFEVRVPAVGESVQEGEVYKWHIEDGAQVELDDVLVELETDKATVEIVAEASGSLKIVAAEGDTVKVGDLLAKIDTAAAAAESSPPSQPEASPVPPPPPPSRPAPGGEKILSPAAQRAAKQHGVDPTHVEGTGRGGRLTKEDVMGARGVSAAASPAPAAPAPASAPAPSVAPSAPPVPKPQPGSRGTRREKMSRLRQKIAERLVEAQHTAAMLTTFNEVDMTAVMALRKSYKEDFKEAHGVGLGFMSFFVKAAVEALKAFPEINGYVDGKEVVYHDYQDIGIAVSTDKGLMVPVVRNCETMSFADVERAIMDYALKGRAGKISLDELSGGTFTISNGGVFGSLMSTPILNPPQSAILGMHKIQQRPMVVNGEIVVRPMMYLALSYDHRIVDGKGAVGFLVKIKDAIEDPQRLLLGV